MHYINTHEVSACTSVPQAWGKPSKRPKLSDKASIGDLFGGRSAAISVHEHAAAPLCGVDVHESQKLVSSRTRYRASYCWVGDWAAPNGIPDTSDTMYPRSTVLSLCTCFILGAVQQKKIKVLHRIRVSSLVPHVTENYSLLVKHNYQYHWFYF